MSPVRECMWLHCTIDLDIDETWGDDAVLAVQLDISRALFVKEEFLWVEDLPLSHPQVLPRGTVTHTKLRCHLQHVEQVAVPQ